MVRGSTGFQPTDHLRVSPFTATPTRCGTAASAGAHIYHNECAKCHGNDAMGIYGRPKLVSGRIADASDGDLFWIMNNGVPWRGMPPWNMLPAKQRWQLVAYLRSLELSGCGITTIVRRRPGPI